MSRRQRTILVVVLAFLLVATIGGGIWWVTNRPDNETVTPLSNEATNEPGPTTGRSPVVNPVLNDQATVLRTARLFTERFGSFSTDERQLGIQELRPLMTAKLRQWMETNYLTEIAARYNEASYAGESMTVLSARVTTRTESAATVALEVQRTVVVESGQPRTDTQTIRLELIKQDSQWLVDGFFVED